MQPSANSVELINRIIRSFRAFGFFIFSKRYYPEVLNVLRLTNTVRLLRIGELDGSKGYYILEPDITVCTHTCRDRCSEKTLNGKCINECLYSCRVQVMESILSNLTNYVTPTKGLLD